MSSDASQLPDCPVRPAAETVTALSPDDIFAARLRGFGPIGIFAILLILLTGNVVVGKKMLVLPIGAVFVLLWTWRSRTPWREIGYSRPKSWIGAVALGIAFGISFKFLMKGLVMPLLGADPINHAYHFLSGNRAMLPSAIWAMLVAGFGEETVVRGYAFERLGKLFGSGVAAKTVIVLLTSALFGLDHYRLQGLAGAEQAAIVGLVYGTIFAVTGRIWVIMCAHAAFDLTALALIYWNLEYRVAHFLLK
jgi:membrane protease YdiL (CAAX protease family)